ncbi:hypothetical protein EGT07_23815 [Herbaspirillum sp. HC18]|nr:hypothetical protein EGT07_23815 [Herbaspirillum sp. HC18]
MRPALPTIFEQAISKPRLDSYRQYFRPRNIDEAIGIYMWNSELSACISTLLAYFEIALRNNIHQAMSQFYSRGASSSIHWYDTIRASLKLGTVSKIDEVRYEGPPKNRRLRSPAPGPDEIVSRVSFGFWPGVLSTIDPRYADQILPHIFRHHPLNANPADWNVAPTRKAALAFIYELNIFRNRLAHHEPLWKFGAVKDTSVRPPVVILPASTNHADSIARFQHLLALFDNALNSLNQDLHADLLQSSWRNKLEYLLSPRGFARYKSIRHCPRPASVTPTDFRRSFSFIVKDNQPVRIKRANAIGLFIPD